MKITIEICAGPNHRSYVTKNDISKNIAAIDRAIDGNMKALDYPTLLDTKTILEGIKNQLPM